MKTLNFTKFPIHETINQKAEQRAVQLKILRKTFGLNPFYIFSDNREKPGADNGHDWMNN